MAHINIEIKARCDNPQRIRTILEDCSAEFRGIDHQVDTYFNVDRGRLKLRQGNIENSLIHYDRPNQVGPKPSVITLYKLDPGSTLKTLLTRALGVLVVVDKHREIYFIDNVKFHIDAVRQLGSFVEIEAIDTTGLLDHSTLLGQCRRYMDLLAIQEHDLLDCSYSDMLLGDT